VRHEGTANGRLPEGAAGCIADFGLRIADCAIRPIRPIRHIRLIRPLSAIANCGLRIVESRLCREGREAGSTLHQSPLVSWSRGLVVSRSRRPVVPWSFFRFLLLFAANQRKFLPMNHLQLKTAFFQSNLIKPNRVIFANIVTIQVGTPRRGVRGRSAAPLDAARTARSRFGIGIPT